MKMRPAINRGLLCAVGLAAFAPLLPADSVPLGASTCSTSGCHGGAGDKSDQYAVWSQLDAHSRSYATLTTARAARMADALAIANPAESPRCVICHAPLGGVSPA